MIQRALLLAALIAMTGCSGLQQFTMPKEVKVPVPVPCIKEQDRIPRPALITDRELAGADDYTLVLELAADRLKRQGYEAKLEAQAAGCI